MPPTRSKAAKAAPKEPRKTANGRAMTKDEEEMAVAFLTHNPKYSDGTVSNQVAKMVSIRKALGPTETWKKLVEDTARMRAHVNKTYNTEASRANTFSTIWAATKGLGMPKETIDFYYAAMKDKSAARDVILNENLPAQRMVDAGMIVLPWDDVVEKVRKTTTLSQYHMVMAMYTLIPPRRGDYRYLYYYDSAPLTPEPTAVKDKQRPVEERIDDKGVAYNYVFPKSSTVMRMVLRTSKVAKLGVYTVDLPADLSEVIKNYVDKHGIESGATMFKKPRKKNEGDEVKLYDQSAWTYLVNTSAKTVLGIEKPKIGIDDLRHAAVTAHRADRKHKTSDHERLAYAMGHSVNVANLVYDRTAELEIAAAIQRWRR